MTWVLGKLESEGESQIIVPAGSRCARSKVSIPNWVIELGLRADVTLLKVGEYPSNDHRSIQSHKTWATNSRHKCQTPMLSFYQSVFLFYYYNL